MEFNSDYLQSQGQIFFNICTYSSIKKKQFIDLDVSIREKENVAIKVEMIPNPAGWGRHMMVAVNKVNKQKAE